MEPEESIREEGAWKFNRGTWSEVEEGVYSLLQNKQVESLSDALDQAGYGREPAMKLGRVDRYGYSVEVYCAAVGKPPPEYPYYVMIGVGPGVECIYVTDFPGLLMLLDQAGTIIGKLEQLPGVYGVSLSE
jgi:hypothetical protein